MKALITGGAGFIGSHLAEKLVQQQHSVTVVDDLSTGRAQNLAKLHAGPDFEFVKANACDADLMAPLIESCDIVFHLAAAVGVKLIVEKPVHTIQTNIHGTETILDLASKHRKKVLITSTSEVYGKSEKVPFREEDDTVLGSTMFSRWSYACSKAIDEFLALAYHDQFGLEVIITRLFNTIGPRQVGQYGMVVPRFVQAALANEPINIYGTGKQTRCFTYVGDVVDALIALVTTEGTEGRVYNIGSTEEVTIEELANMIIARTNSSSRKNYIPYQKAYGRPFDDMLRRVPSLERIRRTIGYQPDTDLNQTLDSVIKWCKANPLPGNPNDLSSQT
ncbi:dTDP-glucose 4,6-dehydratase [Anaerohalosphaera lusitana]|uniref:UDP-glucuronate decarboxylase n=1 Tax=Anaerohalosphaera lusitana TaxID=1936003 RepID=A0A1U9NJ52_9BACT|nr:GDP-mannose 4,6-dehydratase [Anaerohalosphaera lusitana]AQT67764.1 dTDP-glucose 4,6-dehydratase [Anaerohalosphaera lusitana]